MTSITGQLRYPGGSILPAALLYARQARCAAWTCGDCGLKPGETSRTTCEFRVGSAVTISRIAAGMLAAAGQTISYTQTPISDHNFNLGR